MPSKQQYFGGIMLQKMIQFVRWLRANRLRRSVAYSISYFVCLGIYYSVRGFDGIESWHIGLIIIVVISSAAYLYWHYPFEQ
jgi:hypothetical protein